ncbi:D-3-phosphoglycerate dehydrogenase [Candidatus Hydrogenisulfobacillus filiaventi]|uniref:D-3-phosphoglycerate dehydrogenase n=1 Tax=Candidatus Hydrogenisulfobacillus filiaventi TaxID=2707344 RepID=A0A6F8ZDN2_9FIRM|nr:phosphoglycerate dehydrogenase [Bacillota bacterium]CAB1127978.1 D-3-phosphoglycerate dehydrogenase [Candidatus Hydrogenisulfobacillus filiaventi]
MAEERPHILVAEELGPAGLNYLRERAEVEAHKKLPPEELDAHLEGKDAVIIRSSHRITREIVERHPQLKVVARAGSGVDNVDLNACTEYGITVINAPGANAIAAAEHTFGLLLAAMRNIPAGDRHVREGGWNRAAFLGAELHERRLGIIGFGRVGREVARIAQGFRMPIMVFDPYVSADMLTAYRAQGAETLEELVEWADILTIHTPKGGPRLGYELLRRMRKGSVVVNASRGGLFDEDAIVRLLDEGILYRAALDVFAVEPPPADSPLLKRTDVVLTPHLGGSTDEALAKVGLMTAQGVMEALAGRTPFNTVNVPVPVMDPEVIAKLDRATALLGKLFWFFERSLPKTIFLSVNAMPQASVPWLRQSLIARLLEPVSDERVNTVNAMKKAEEHGFRVNVGLEGEAEENKPVTLAVVSGSSTGQPLAEVEVNGALRLKQVGGVPIDAVWPERAILTEHNDRPGVMGQVGTILGQHNVNIAGLTLGRSGPGGPAYMVLAVDEEVPEEALEAIRALPGMNRAAYITL